MEIWETIPGYPRYEASTFGNIRHIKHQRILKQAVPYNRYLQVKISGNGIKGRKSICVHQIIALTFLGVKPEGYEVNHKDGDRSNNHLDNLEYIPWRENRSGHPPIKKICPVCKREFYTLYSSPSIHCSAECYHNSCWTELKCSYCGKIFLRRNSYIRRDMKDPRYANNGKRSFCSRYCYNKGRIILRKNER